MDQREEILEDLERYLQFMKVSGVQYLPILQAEPSHDLPLTCNDNSNAALEQKNITDISSEPTLEDIRIGCIDCARCDLCGLRTNIIFGSGNANADLMFIGASPGRAEDIEGEPFIGASGDLLTKIIESIKLRREDVYMTNVVKCTTPEDRSPTVEEARSCMPVLISQIEAIKPLVICSLGETAARILLDTSESISSLRGKFHDFNGLPLMPTYHPSYILKNTGIKRDVWEDIKQIKKMLEKRD